MWLILITAPVQKTIEVFETSMVAALQNILHPVSVARKVMERTEHTLLVGAGALDFGGGCVKRYLSKKSSTLYCVAGRFVGVQFSIAPRLEAADKI